MEKEKRLNIKYFLPVFGAVIVVILLMANPTTVYGAPQHGFGRNPGRIDTVNENDFHTSQWDRFIFNYEFISGSDHRFVLGNPTTFNGFVPFDVFTVNIRRDANVSLRPPHYGIFSGQFPTHQVSFFFPHPVDPNYYQVFIMESPNVDPRFDTLQQGVNAGAQGNPLTSSPNVSIGEFLPPTSIN